MTTDEMEKRWPQLPPYQVIIARFTGAFSREIDFIVDQDSIDEIIEYLQAAKESMNA
jgi:hypothetical protein